MHYLHLFFTFINFLSTAVNTHSTFALATVRTYTDRAFPTRALDLFITINIETIHGAILVRCDFVETAVRHMWDTNVRLFDRVVRAEKDLFNGVDPFAPVVTIGEIPSARSDSVLVEFKKDRSFHCIAPNSNPFFFFNDLYTDSPRSTIDYVEPDLADFVTQNRQPYDNNDQPMSPPYYPYSSFTSHRVSRLHLFASRQIDILDVIVRTELVILARTVHEAARAELFIMHSVQYQTIKFYHELIYSTPLLDLLALDAPTAADVAEEEEQDTKVAADPKPAFDVKNHLLFRYLRQHVPRVTELPRPSQRPQFFQDYDALPEDFASISCDLRVSLLKRAPFAMLLIWAIAGLVLVLFNRDPTIVVKGQVPLTSNHTGSQSAVSSMIVDMVMRQLSKDVKKKSGSVFADWIATHPEWPAFAEQIQRHIELTGKPITREAIAEQLALSSKDLKN